MGFCVTSRTILVFSGVFTFLVDAYPTFAASALAANSFMRSSFGGIFPLFGIQSKCFLLRCFFPYPANSAEGSVLCMQRVIYPFCRTDASCLERAVGNLLFEGRGEDLGSSWLRSDHIENYDLLMIAQCITTSESIGRRHC